MYMVEFVSVSVVCCSSVTLYFLQEGEHVAVCDHTHIYEGWNFNSGNYLFTTDTK